MASLNSLRKCQLISSTSLPVWLDDVVPLAMKRLRLMFTLFISSSETFLPVGYFRRSRRHATLKPFAVVVLAIKLTIVS